LGTITKACAYGPDCVVIVSAMTHNQYEQHKRRLEEQLRAGIQLLENAYQAQVRALELVWMLQAETGESQTFVSPESAPAPSPPKEEAPPPPSRTRRRGIGELEHDVRTVLPRLPETFTRRDICTAIGYEPDRSSLYRALQELVSKGTIRIESKGTGQIPTLYRQTGAPDAFGAG
jgi:hypothetical protein